jgi:TPR repeat protein
MARTEPAVARTEPAPARVEPGLDAREAAALVSRAEQLLAGGDLQSARLLLLRAVKARDGHAALVLAKTYDPIELKQLGATGPQPDPALARSWYQKAKEWGSPDAQAQLDAMASSGR